MLIAAGSGRRLVLSAKVERRIVVANIIEIARAIIIAYNEKNWNKVKDMLAADAVYNEKVTTVKSKALAKSSMLGRAGLRPSPTPRPHSSASSRAATPRFSRLCGRAFTRDHCRHQQVTYRH
jgi:hypothetical protein